MRGLWSREINLEVATNEAILLILRRLLDYSVCLSN